MKTELRSDEADCGGVGVFGDVGTEAEAVVSGSVSAMLRKVILCGGSLSRGTGWPFRVPEVDVRTGRIPGDFRVYTVFLGCGAKNQYVNPRKHPGGAFSEVSCGGNTYKSRRLPAVPWLDVQRHFEQVVIKLLLAPAAHRVQVLKEALSNRQDDTS